MEKPYYSVGDVLFKNKLDALLASTKNNKQVHWHWHEEYSSLDWSKDSTLSVKEWYKIRAQNLRDTYDWLILSFSGGADSWNVLRVFLENKIHIDEIFTYNAVLGSQNLHKFPEDRRDPGNIHSEYKYAAMPVLKYLKKYYPKTLITVKDYSSDIKSMKYSDTLLQHSGDVISPGFWTRHMLMGNNEKSLIDKGKKTCFILAVDKPRICLIDNALYCYFLDITYNLNIIYDQEFNLNRNVEFFYWNKKYPQLVHAQAREIYHAIQATPQLKKRLSRLITLGNLNTDDIDVWNMFIKSIIYPDYDQKTFQAQKDLYQFNSAQDRWIRKILESTQLKQHDHLLQNLLQGIDKKFIRYHLGKPAGFTGFTSSFFKLGELQHDD